jgi:hypothetical protein
MPVGGRTAKHLNRLTTEEREINNRCSNQKGLRLMKMLTRAALALSGGAAALVLALAVVLAVVMVVVLLFAAIPLPPTWAGVTPAPPAPAAPAPTGGAHIGSLTGSIDRPDC